MTESTSPRAGRTTRRSCWRRSPSEQRQTIGLGTSVISAWGRTPATIALGAASLQRASGGRFAPGIGASSLPLTEGFHGVTWRRPVKHLRETLTAVRALLTGDRQPNPAEGARPLRLGIVPEQQVPIVLAALSPASIRLAGELSSPMDGRLSSGRARNSMTAGRSCETASPARSRTRALRTSPSASPSPSLPTNGARDGSPRGGYRPTRPGWVLSIRGCLPNDSEWPQASTR